MGAVDPDLSSPFILNWSLAVEHEITRDMVASIGYVGSHSGNLVVGGGNTGATSYGNDVNAFSGDLLQHPNFDSSDAYTGSGTQTRLNTSFGGINYAFNGPIANYQALIVAVKGRFARRGFLTASYTHGKAMDNWENYPIAYPFYHFYAPSRGCRIDSRSAPVICCQEII